LHIPDLPTTSARIRSMATRLPQIERRGSEDQAKACASPVSSPVASPSILSTSPVRGGDQFRLGAAQSASSILGTSPWPRDSCYLQAMSPMGGGHSGAILGTSPSAKPCPTAVILMPGMYAASPVADSSQSGSGFFPEQSSQQQQQQPRQQPETTEAPQTPRGKVIEAHAGEEDGDAESEEPGSPYMIKNTFINTPLQRSPSLEKFFGVRKVHSSPPSVMMDLGRSDNPFMIATPSGASLEESEVESTVKAAARFLEEDLACTLITPNVVGSASDLGGSTRAETLVDPPQHTTGSGRFSDASRPAETPTDEPVVGSKELPSRGSALHKWGACKPCAFVGNGVCRNDVNCQFCHLCEPGEKKRRRKEWLESKRELRKQADAIGVVGRQQHPQGQHGLRRQQVQHQGFQFAGLQQHFEQPHQQMQQSGFVGAR